MASYQGVEGTIHGNTIRKDRTMKSNDEDLELFLEDFGHILRKYNYDISPFSLRKITDTSIILGGFRADMKDGEPFSNVLVPEYFIRSKRNLDIIGGGNEN